MGLLQNFPSFNNIIKGAGKTFIRFPFTVLSALTGTIVGIIIIELDPDQAEQFLKNMLLLTGLGLPLFTAIALFVEKKGWGQKFSLVIQSLGILFLIGYYFSIPENPFELMHVMARFFLLNICFHFLVAFLPYIDSKETNGFWEYNKGLFLRFLTAALYSAVLFIGLALALAAVDHLFGVDVDPDIYMELWVIIAVLVNTCIFLGGIPVDLNSLDGSLEYPKGLKVFTQYILLPLVFIYFTILIIYEGKILFTWNWPKGWVSQLVLWYSVIGILSLLLLHPLRKISENKWISVFSRWFFLALIPLVGMLYLAIIRRISDYGFTENRYYVLVMAIGLSIVVLYFIFSKVKDIKIIPMTICVLALLSAFGPWGSFAVAKKAQQTRLQEFLQKNEMIIDGEFQKSNRNISFDDRKEMSSIIEHLKEWHGTEPFYTWLDDTTITKLDSMKYLSAQTIAEYFGFDYVSRWVNEETGESFHLKSKRKESVEIDSYRYLLDYQYYFYGGNDTNTITTYTFTNDTFYVKYNYESNILQVHHGKSFDSSEAKLSLDINKLLNRHTDSTYKSVLYNYKMTIFAAGPLKQTKFLIKNVGGTIRNDTILVNNMQAFIMIN